VAERAWLIVTVHVSDVPEQSAPLQPVNVWPVPGVAVSVTTVPAPKTSEQKVLPFPQEIVPRLDVTTPLPPTETASANVCSVKVAVTERACDIVTWHVPVPLHPSPDQPPKIQPALGDALSVTTVEAA
jgi:hypothetical protein